MHLGYPDKGHVSAYYPDSPGITHDEIEHVSDFLKNKGLMPENTRLRKASSGDYELLIASAVTEPARRDLKESEWTLEGPLKGKKLTLVYGDYSIEMGKVARNLTEAKKYTLNDEEDKMQGEYVSAFHDGSMFAHLDSQRHWIKVKSFQSPYRYPKLTFAQDKGPNVECNIGFIETYRDPHGIRVRTQRADSICRAG